MVAGEFAVLEPYHKLVVMAVNRYVYAKIEESSNNQVVLTDFDLQLNWHWKDGSISLTPTDPRIHFVENAMNIAGKYLQEQSIIIGHFSLTIHSELDDESGIKYGLGSSAAVVTAVVTAILSKYLPYPPSKELIFKLASIAHVVTQKNGSGADIAASTFGGVLLYSSFQADWLLKAYDRSGSLTKLVEDVWPYFSLQRIEIPNSLKICVGWTGKPASTADLVKHILQLKETHPEEFKEFLQNSETALQYILQGIAENNTPLILRGIRLNRIILGAIGMVAGVEIETPLLAKLTELAEQFGGAGKLSGAGGGDCGIAFMPSEEAANNVVAAWRHANIKPLDLSISRDGASIV